MFKCSKLENRNCLKNGLLENQVFIAKMEIREKEKEILNNKNSSRL